MSDNDNEVTEIPSIVVDLSGVESEIANLRADLNSFASKMLQAVGNIAGQVEYALTDEFEAMMDMVDYSIQTTQNVGQQIMGGISDALDTVGEFFREAIGSFADAVRAVGQAVSELGQKIMNGIVDGITQVGIWLEQGLQYIKTALTDFKDKFVESITNIAKLLKDTMMEAIGWIRDKLVDLGRYIRDGLIDLTSSVLTIAAKIRDALTTIVSYLIDAVKQWIEGIKEALLLVWTKLEDMVNKLTDTTPETIANGVLQMLEGQRLAAQRVVDKFGGKG